MAESINQLASQSIWDAGGAPVQSEVALHISSAVSETDEMKMSVREPEGLELSRASSAQDEALALPLIRRLCSSLRERGVVYCHWKSNWKLADWLRGEGDLDLLVDRADAQAFASVLYSLGFKQAEPSSDRQMPGILNYYGFDVEANRFVHLHVHYQLVLGHDLTKNFRLPIEKLYLESAARRDFIPIPAPELELILFTLRMVLKYSAAEAGIGRALGRSKVGGSALVRELDYLEARADIIKVRAILEQHLSFIDTAFFDRCMGSLRAGSPVWTRTVVRRELKKHL
jgi:hypothetical protein